jgi:phosphoribosylanthranilate isomerase
MRIKICGLFREQDIEYVNEALPDFAGFVFAPSKRQVSEDQALALRFNLDGRITPVGVFVNAPVEEIASLYRNDIISIAQLHGEEDEEYITKLKAISDIPIIKTFKLTTNPHEPSRTNDICQTTSLCGSWLNNPAIIDYIMLDSGAGTGKAFNWDNIEPEKITKPWFLAGGINLENIEKAASFKPFAVDVSSGAETDGIKDREKILQLVNIARKGNS